ncbi:hypothetical protein B1R94_10345 [Mycolicibacterium litorale]|nr:hypothetical protein B1R94_10345 [Mycolicibacterium litorale]
MALVGAGILAASPIAAPVPDLHLPAIHVDATTLMAAVSPADTYKQVFETAVTNIQALVADADPGEVIKQVVANQISALTTLGAGLNTAGAGVVTALTSSVPQLLNTVFTQLAAGDVQGATNALLTVPLVVAQPLINLVPSIVAFNVQPIQNLIKVAGVFSDPLQDALYAVGLLGPVISGLGAAGAAVQGVVDAVGTGDPQQIANAILTGPAVIADGLLNGGYGPDLGPLVGPGLKVLAGGLFSKGGLSLDPSGDIVLNVAGPVATLQQLAHQIATAITPAPPVSQTVAAHVRSSVESSPASAGASAASEKAPAADAPETPAHDAPKTPAAITAKPTKRAAHAAPAAKDGAATAPSSAGKHTRPARTRGHSAR